MLVWSLAYVENIAKEGVAGRANKERDAGNFGSQTRSGSGCGGGKVTNRRKCCTRKQWLKEINKPSLKEKLKYGGAGD